MKNKDKIEKYFLFTNDKEEITKIISFYHHLFIQDKTLLQRLKRFKSLIALLVRRPQFKYLNNNSKFTFFYGDYSREDYKELYDIIVSTNNDYSELSISYKKGFSIKNFVRLIKSFRDINSIRNNCCEIDIRNRSLFKKVECSRLEGLYIAIQLIKLLDVQEQIPNINCECFVVFSDVQPLAHVLVSMVNKQGGNTVTLQHALFSEQIKSTLDSLNYIKVPSKYILAWGEKTAKLFKKYNEGIKYFVVGNPLLSKKQYYINEDYIGVMLDQQSFKEYNIKMLKIVSNVASILNKKVKIRVHPFDSQNNYMNISDRFIFDNNLDDCYILLGHTSTIVITSLAVGRRVYQYNSDCNYNKITEEFCFSNKEELIQCINATKEISCDVISENYICSLGDEAKKNYECVWNNFISKK